MESSSSIGSHWRQPSPEYIEVLMLGRTKGGGHYSVRSSRLPADRGTHTNFEHIIINYAAKIAMTRLFGLKLMNSHTWLPILYRFFFLKNIYHFWYFSWQLLHIKGLLAKRLHSSSFPCNIFKIGSKWQTWLFIERVWIFEKSHNYSI
jgi:hypothetical protein